MNRREGVMRQYLLNPRGVFHHEEVPIAPRPSSLDQKVLGLLDNSKPNADRFLNHVEKFITERVAIPEIVRIRKSAASGPASLTPEFFQKCDVVINAFGD